MLIEYLLSRRDEIHPRKLKNSKILKEDITNPSDILRIYNIRIKRAIPYEKYVEIFLFDDVRGINFKDIFKRFHYKIDYNENKVLVGYNVKEV